MDGNNWTYIKKHNDLSSVLFVGDSRTKGIVGKNLPRLYKAQCFIGGDKQTASRKFDPNNLYVPVIRHETIRRFLAKAAGQELLLEPAEVFIAYFMVK